MFRKYKATVAAILTVVILITVTFLGFGLTAGSAYAAQNTLLNVEYFFDLDTGTVIHIALTAGDQPTSDCDFHTKYYGTSTQHMLEQNTYEVEVELAYSEEDYDNVEFNDVAALSFTTDVIIEPFNKVAVIHTPEGNYFKVGFVSADGGSVTFQWHQLIPGYNDGYEAGYQAASAEIEAFLEEVKNLLATPPGQRSSTSSYEGKMKEIIEMLLAPSGSNISEETPQGKKK